MRNKNIKLNEQEHQILKEYVKTEYGDEHAVTFGAVIRRLCEKEMGEAR